MTASNYILISLIVRAWPEKNAAGRPDWRGSVEDVARDEKIYFKTRDDLLLKIQHIMDDPSSGDGRPDR